MAHEAVLTVEAQGMSDGDGPVHAAPVEHAEHAAVLIAGAMLLRLGLWALGEIELSAGDAADLAARGLDELGHLAQLVQGMGLG